MVMRVLLMGHVRCRGRRRSSHARACPQRACPRREACRQDKTLTGGHQGRRAELPPEGGGEVIRLLAVVPVALQQQPLAILLRQPLLNTHCARAELPLGGDRHGTAKNGTSTLGVEGGVESILPIYPPVYPIYTLSTPLSILGVDGPFFAVTHAPDTAPCRRKLPLVSVPLVSKPTRPLFPSFF